MQTITKQTKSLLVDLDNHTKDFNNPIIKAFKYKGAVYGFAAYYIVEDKLKLTQTNINNVDLLVDSENKTYKVHTTKDVSPAFTKGYARSKCGVDIKTHLINQSDYLCILEEPKNNKEILTIFKTTDVIVNDKGILQ